MVRVEKYELETVKFCCDKCDFSGEYDISSMLSDNCVIDIDVICELCGDMCVIYILKCNDLAQAKDLSARFEFLKYKRSVEEKNNDYSNDG